jgi:hypothetical protein
MYSGGDRFDSGKEYRLSWLGLSVAWACACAYMNIALLIQHATRMRHIVMSFVAPRSPLFCSTLSHKHYDFRKKVIQHKMCVFIFSTTFFVQNISLSRKKRDIVKNVEMCSCKVPVILVGFSWNLNFLGWSSKKFQVSNFIKIRPLGEELFHADGRWHETKVSLFTILRTRLK